MTRSEQEIACIRATLESLQLELEAAERRVTRLKASIAGLEDLLEHSPDPECGLPADPEP